jgi:hypothetical protein
MATAITPKPRKARKSAPTTCRLTLALGSTTYIVRPIASELHSRAWSLRKPDGTAYHVTQDQHGHHCDCGDFVWRHEGNGTACKHVRALRVFQLLDVTPRASTAARVPVGRIRDDFDSP